MMATMAKMNAQRVGPNSLPFSLKLTAFIVEPFFRLLFSMDCCR
jgi:hypothetical protein